MSGSNLQFNLPANESRKHNELINRNLPFQHKLESIYRESDNKDLATILSELSAQEHSVLCEYIKITEDNTTLITLTKFQYNLSKDILFVQVCGCDVYEGTDCDYVKTSPTQITFNYPLKSGYDVFVAIAGTISTESFGSDIYTALSKFTQLVDAPSSYYGHANQGVQVNESETGLIFKPIKATNDLTLLEATYNISEGNYLETWMEFVHSGIIKGIKVTPVDGYVGDFTLSIWTKPNGGWIYYSGDIQTILWDIMDIPFIDESTQDSVYIKLVNNGPTSDFKIQIYVAL